MSENTGDLRNLPYEHLLQKHNINVSDLDEDTQAMIKDLKQTTQVLLNKAGDGEVKITAQTNRKVNNYDRYICEGIFNHLEAGEETPQDDEEERLREIHEQSQPQLQDIEVSSEPEAKEEDTPTAAPAEETDDKKESYSGFWDWD